MKWFCNRCDLVLAPSGGMQEVIKGYGVNTPTAVFPTGLDGSFYRADTIHSRQIREKYGRGKQYLFVTVSRLEKEKNYGFLLRGIAEFRKQTGDDFHVLIIGEGSQKSELKVRASILGIQDMVTFVGNVPNDEVKDYLNASDLFLFASKSETQGIVLAEALAAGIPVAAVHAVGSDDIIRDGVNGFLTEEKDEVWAQKAAEILREENYGRMKAAARRSAENYRSQDLRSMRRCSTINVGSGKETDSMGQMKMGESVLQWLFARYLNWVGRTVTIRWDEDNRYGDSQIFGFWHEDSFFMNLVLEKLAHRTTPVDVIVTRGHTGKLYRRYGEEMWWKCAARAGRPLRLSRR